MRGFDVIIVGGAVHGASLAYHLAADAGFGGSVLLIEKDPSFAFAATALSAGSIRQQFSSAINIAISLYGIDFLRSVGELLEVDGERPDIGLSEGGYLFLATQGGAATLTRNHALQTDMGADILHLDPDALQARFPYVAADDIAAGAWGRRGEGWFDGYQLMQALRRKARALGVETLTGEVATILHDGRKATGVRLADGTSISGGAVALAAGTGTPRLAASVGVALPVEARKRMVFTFACREPLPGFPLLIDPSGAYVRPEGDLYLCRHGAAGGERPAGDATSPSTMLSSRRRCGRSWPPGCRPSRRSSPGAPGPATTISTPSTRTPSSAPCPVSPISSWRPASPATACSRRRPSDAGSPS